MKKTILRMSLIAMLDLVDCGNDFMNVMAEEEAISVHAISENQRKQCNEQPVDGGIDLVEYLVEQCEAKISKEAISICKNKKIKQYLKSKRRSKSLNK